MALTHTKFVPKYIVEFFIKKSRHYQEHFKITFFHISSSSLFSASKTYAHLTHSSVHSDLSFTAVRARHLRNFETYASSFQS
jgi:hypothetical protein